MAIGQDSSKIKQFSSENAVFRESTGNGSYTGTLVESPLIENLTFEDTTEQTTRTDNGGNNYNIDGARTRNFSGNWMQTDVDTLKALSTTYRGKNLFWVQELDKTDGVYLVIPKAKVNPSFTFSTPGGQVPFALTPEKLTSDLDVAMADFDSSLFSSSLSGTLTISASDGYAFYQQA